MKKLLQISVLFSVLALSALIISQSNIPTAGAVTTYWYKVAPNTCTINAGGSDPDQAEHESAGTLKLNSTSGTLGISAYCPIFIPHGASLNLLRIRTFQSGGLPNYTDIRAYLMRRTWNGSITTLATADMDPGDTYDDASFSTTVDNGNYHYLIHLYLYKTSSATTMPEIEMLEVRYTI